MIDRNPHVKVRTERGGRPLNNTAPLNMQPSEAYGQAASSTSRRSNSSSSTESLWHLINIKNIRKMRKRHNPLIVLSAQAVVEKCLRNKVFILKINVIRNKFFENFEKEKMLKL